MSNKFYDGSGKDNEKGNSSSIGSGNGNGWKTRKQGFDEATQRLAQLKITPGREKPAEKKPPGLTSIKNEKIQTNLLNVQLSPQCIYVYDVEVTGITSKQKRVDLMRRSGDDYTSVFRRTLCFEAFKIICAGKGFDDKIVYYDGQKILYSLERLKFIQSKNEETFIVEINGQRDFNMDMVSIEFKVKEVAKDFALNNIGGLLKDVKNADRTLLHFIELATSQHALLNTDDYVAYDGGRFYIMNPRKYGFAGKDCPDLPEGKFVLVGSRKSATAMEGPNGRGSCGVGLVLDTSKTAFHRCQTVLNKAIAIVPELLERKIDPLNLTRLREQLIGLFAEKRENGNSCVFQITQVSSRNALEVNFLYKGQNITIAEYFKQRYDLELKYPMLPLLVNKKAKGRESYFPMELCYIIEKQRVKQKQQTAAQLKGMREACIVPPAKRLENNAKNIEALKLSEESNIFLRSAGINVQTKPLVVDARLLPPPLVSYGRNQDVRVDPDKMWSIGRRLYLAPATVRRWAAYLIADPRERISEHDFTMFLKQLIRQANAFGMKLDLPDDYARIPPDKHKLENTIRVAKQERCTFIFFVQTDGACLHDAIKQFERQYEIVTQDLKVTSLINVISKGRRQTLENIVNKLNIKLGGLNYSVHSPDCRIAEFLHDKRLVIGFSMTHPDPPSFKEIAKGTSSTPSVVGYASNSKRFNCEFVGDFGFQDARRTENVFLIDELVKRIVEQFLRNRSPAPGKPGNYPEEVIIYRAGISEGQFPILLDYEIPLIRKGLLDAGCNSGVKVTMIVVSRTHNFRLIPNELDPRSFPSNQNCRPGTVLDEKLVHPCFSEFYLNSHKCLQGTAKTPRYTVIVDDSGFSLDTLEMMTYALCYCHQIVNLPTSVPAPLYIAGRYAERGRRIMLESCSESYAGSSTTKSVGSNVDMHKVNKELPYYGTALAEARINA